MELQPPRVVPMVSFPSVHFLPRARHGVNLPLGRIENEDEGKQEGSRWDYIYEPDDSRMLMDGLMERYIESLLYQAVIENIACEQAAKMVAMKSATDNAGALIDELQLVYNNARQAAITQEISEIVAGAEAL